MEAEEGRPWSKRRAAIRLRKLLHFWIRISVTSSAAVSPPFLNSSILLFLCQDTREDPEEWGPRRVKTQGCLMIDYPPLDLSIKKRYSVYSSNQVNNRTLSSRIPPQWPHKEKTINNNINCDNDINKVAFYVIDLFGIAIL